MYIFYFEFFDDFEKRKFKIIKKFKTKNLHVANESCCKYEKVSLKNILYFRRSKKDKFSKVLESLENVGQMEGPARSDLMYSSH
jgi:hypothetical protein